MFLTHTHVLCRFHIHRRLARRSVGSRRDRRAGRGSRTRCRAPRRRSGEHGDPDPRGRSRTSRLVSSPNGRAARAASTSVARMPQAILAQSGPPRASAYPPARARGAPRSLAAQPLGERRFERTRHRERGDGEGQHRECEPAPVGAPACSSQVLRPSRPGSGDDAGKEDRDVRAYQSNVDAPPARPAMNPGRPPPGRVRRSRRSRHAPHPTVSAVRALMPRHQSAR